MRIRLRHSALATVLAASTLILPFHAGAGAAPQLNSSQVSVLLTASMVLSIPLALSAGIGRLSDAASESTARHSAKRTKAQKLPPMEVKAVETADNGDPVVRLQVPGEPDQHATLRWAQNAPNPATRFDVGDMVYLDPTDTGAGWNVKDDDGQLLAFVPTEAAAADNSSQRW